MKLIADSGSTKTKWALLDGQGLVSMYDSIGLNPRLVDVEPTLREVAQWVGTHEVEEVLFYGAGCGTEEACAKVRAPLQSLFPSANVIVDSDLIGACVASAGTHFGFVGILGTGSNACLYDGERIIQQRPSLGYVLGDEGSGNHIGKCLLKAYFERRMPEELRQAFARDYNLDYTHVISQLYSNPRPNAYLASFAPFASKHHRDATICTIVCDCFVQYYEHLVRPIWKGDIHLVGSVAYFFQDELRAVSRSLGYTVKSITQSPIEGLIRYYSSKK